MPQKLMLLLSLLISLHLAAAELLPDIRHVNQSPFTPDGKRIEQVWDTADRMIRFVTYRRNEAALYPSEGSVLFDDSCLYVSLTAWDDPQGQRSSGKQSLFANNNFEFFIRPGAPGSAFYQIAGDDLGQLYTGISQQKAPLPGLKHWAHRLKDRWQLNLALPFAALGITAPTEDLPIRLAFMRNNISTYSEKFSEVSCYQPMELAYAVPDLWAHARMTRRPGKARAIPGPTNGKRINLMPDSELNRPFPSTPTRKHMETMALSGEWIIRVSGDIYQFGSFRPAEFEPDTVYTLVVRARNFGGEGNLRIVQIKRMPNGTYSEHGPYVASNLSLTPDFHEYHIAFRTSKETPWNLAFYKLGDKRSDCGIDIAAIKCFKGKISPFEIRQLSRANMYKAVPGTAPAIPDGIYGKSPKAIRALAIVSNKLNLREPLEIFAGTSILCDTLAVTGKNQDIYETNDNGKDITNRLNQNDYDLYLIGSHIAHSIGKELAAKIHAAVSKGAGLWYGFNKNGGHFQKLLNEAKPAPVQAGSYLTRSYPNGMFPPEDKIEVNQNLREGIFGQGRVIMLSAPSRSKWERTLKIQMAREAYGTVAFPYERYTNAWQVRLAHYLAKCSTTRIETIAICDKQAVVSHADAPANATIAWNICEQNGEAVASGKQNATKNATTIELPPFKTCGKHIITAHLLDANGKTLSYALQTFSRKGPEIKDVTQNQDSYVSTDIATFTVTIPECTSGLTLDWELLDFTGRSLEEGALPAQATTSFSCPLNSLFTNMGRIRLSLMQGNQLVNRTYEPVFVRDLDRKRLLDDYTPAVWPPTGTMEAIDSATRQLETIGIRYFTLPLQGFTNVLAHGMGVGNSWIGGGDTFCGWPQNSNVRKQQFNTKAAYDYFAKSAQRNARRAHRYGVITGAVCDEPNLAFHGTTYELDAHPENLAEYRKRMERKYQTIETYNRRHLTSHKSFADIGQALIKDARATGKYAEFIEWRNFNVDRWCDIINHLGTNAKKVDPDFKYCLWNSFGQGAFSGNDYWKILTKCSQDISLDYTAMVYFGTNPIFNFDELYRSFRPDMRLWGWTGYFFSHERATFMPWWFAAHRYGGFSWYNATSWTYSLVDIPTNALTVQGKAIMDSLDRSNLLRGVGKVFLDYPWKKNDAAIYYSHDSMLLAFALGKETRNCEIQNNGPLHDYFYSRQGIQYLLEELLWQYDFLSSEQVANRKLESYRILFMPAIITLSDQEVAQLKNFLARGGKIVADTMPGIYDELGVKRAKAPFTPDEVTIIGKNFNQLDKAQRTQIMGLLRKAGSQPILEASDILNLNGREAMHFVDGDMHVYVILRMLGRSRDKATQTFTLPSKGHLYDIRAQKYLGQTSTITTQVPHGDAVVYGHYPYQVKDIHITLPDTIKAGTDLKAHIALRTQSGLPAQRHVFHLEVLDPQGQGRFLMKRNVSAPKGTYDLTFRMANNDQPGTWTLKVTDAMTGTVATKTFKLKN